MEDKAPPTHLGWIGQGIAWLGFWLCIGITMFGFSYCAAHHPKPTSSFELLSDNPNKKQ